MGWDQFQEALELMFFRVIPKFDRFILLFREHFACREDLDGGHPRPNRAGFFVVDA